MNEPVEAPPVAGLPENAHRPLRPGETYNPVVPAEAAPPEFTRRALFLGLGMTVLFSAAAAYIALSKISPELYSLGQPAGDPLGTGSNGIYPTSTFIFAFSKVGGTVVVPGVPLPASALFLLGGLGAFGGLRLRKNRPVSA